MKWITENWATIVAILVALPTIATALTKAPANGDAAAWLRWVVGLLSLLPHKSLSLPGLPVSPAPTAPTAPTEPPKAAP